MVIKIVKYRLFMPSTERNGSSKAAHIKKTPSQPNKSSPKKEQEENWKDIPFNIEHFTALQRFHGIWNS